MLYLVVFMEFVGYFLVFLVIMLGVTFLILVFFTSTSCRDISSPFSDVKSVILLSNIGNTKEIKYLRILINFNKDLVILFAYILDFKAFIYSK